MLSIILNDDELDIFEDTEIVWNWTAFRFQTAIRDAYSNNFNIPKTNHNIQVLGVYSLLDSPGVQFEGRLQPAVINLNGQIIPIYIQVCSINEKEIEICVYEDKLVYTIKGSEIGRVKDTPQTIFEWNQYSYELYPQVFKWYNYGAPYMPNFAQIHPSIKLNEILDKIGQEHNVNIQHASDLWRIICTKRTVCPENPLQVIEFNTTGALEDNKFTMFGGQHVTNDLSSSGVTEIEFNRHTEVDMRVWWSFYKKATTTNAFFVYIKKNSDIIGVITLNSSTYTSWNGYNNYSVVFEAGDKLSFEFSHGNKFKSVSFVVRMSHSNYEINEDDYGQEMEYKGRRPRLKTWNGDNFTYSYFDGSQIFPATQYNGMTTEQLSFAYFGLWCNLPKITIGDLLYSLQYILDARCVQREDTIYFDPFIERQNEVEGEVTKLMFHSQMTGQKNYIRWKDGDEQSPIVELVNEWLVKEKDWSKNCFKWIKNNRVVPQYTLNINENAQIEDSDIEHYLEEFFQFDYDDFDEPVLLFFLPPHNQPATLHTFGLDRINNCKEIQLEMQETPPDITETDTIFLDGREYYILSGEKNFKTGKTTIKALLIV